MLQVLGATGGRGPYVNSRVKGQQLPPRKLSSQRKRRKHKEAQLFKLKQAASAHIPLAKNKPHDQPHGQ